MLYGAGRVTYVVTPMILANRDAFKRMKVLLFVNPTYWRPELNRYNHQFYVRYNSDELIQSVEPAARELELLAYPRQYRFHETLEVHKESGGFFAFVNHASERFLSRFRFDVAQFVQSFRPQTKTKTETFEKPTPTIENFQKDVDLAFNVTPQFLGHGVQGLPEISKSTFTMAALKDFLGMARKLDIDLTVLIGPYNGVLGQRVNPGVLKDYDEVIKSIRTLLDEQGVPFIDATDLSFVPGTFTDVQHHSAYGGYLIERKIVEFYRTRKTH